VAVATAVAGLGVLGVVLASDDDASRGPGAIEIQVAEADWSYVIPRGTGDRLDRGEPVDLLPASIDAKVGETIRIENRDDRSYLLGPFYVGPGETLSQRFVSPGRFEGECVVHPSGQLVLNVRT
jgi:hypothetical protein